MDKITQIYKALADKNRIRILKLLEFKPLCVCELAEILGLAQSSTSEHLKVLKDAGFIVDKKESYWVNYYLAKNTNDKFIRSQLSILSRSLRNDVTIKKDGKSVRKIRREDLCK